ncbi:MAG: hypothetical protein UU02_C0034G0004 [Candidatus Woesebacteria bacterium GW2011_GWA1_40_43]|uniref:Uncharacterized protein n=5 Tax=Microgenomates group TaxID=1794810 RepID=A0A0G1N6P8_9BACT|nr:MAG: hypothetical protein UU02_C0034G0004 [Candidatus Woesebacteria bacterium GW2011_GWA1_40_43]KKT66063.1 MAG: hypothetical protein UW60_C0029G0006 [Candidatus Woesebacteria bacterium GW2011_GWA2_44_33]KKT67059.1 MAG: hypothetical protein UW61_C0016G0006 [Candidatus Curtissbacteria bacterium GW2011_GWC1_44_33]KKU16176.1 MAG: hypothetical protein UX25_C0041G0008 [Candidatus Woesebacteria bacterium GW2011_GWC2_45_9]OGM84189.1 MAG: hypothetical protein A2376_02275 [Candidatus Woesebacteria bac
MSVNDHLINIGTAERPVFVPRSTLLPESDERREWWGKLADGSVVLDEKDLDKLLSIIDTTLKGDEAANG